jgi:hypothetical protein
MIEAARDLLVPPRNALELWDALGHPPIQWVDTNHFGLSLAPASLMRASATYLHSVWDDPAADPDDPSPLHAFTLKLGMLIGPESALTPAVQWQAYSFAARRDHMSLLHADLGWSGRGPFLGLAATLNPFLDVGLAQRVSAGVIRPYASVHIVF